MYNLLIVGDLFFEQSEPWEMLAERYLEKAWKATLAFLEMAVSHLTDKITAQVLLDEVVSPQMESR